MIILNSSNYKSKTSAVVAHRFLMMDTTNDYPYALHTDGRDAGVIGVSNAAAAHADEERIQFDALEIGHTFSVEAGETIAEGEQVCPGADGKAYDYDTSADVAVGTCVKGGDDGDIIQFTVDTWFGRVHA